MSHNNKLKNNTEELHKEKYVISFLIPLFGKPKFILRDLINKISELESKDVEFIIVYKNSEDFNYDWMHEYKLPNLQVIGPISFRAQRTKKIIIAGRHARGKWIQIFDPHHDFYMDKLYKKINQLKDIDEKYHILVSSQKIVKRNKDESETTLWKVKPRFSWSIWNGTTLFRADIFKRYLNEFAKFNISLGDDRVYPLVIFNFEQKLKIKYFPKEGYYKQMVYEEQGINTTTGVNFNTTLAKNFYTIANYMADNTRRKSYLHYFAFYWLTMNSFVFYNYMWKGKRAFFDSRRIILRSQLPKRIKLPILFIPWYFTSLTNAKKRYKFRREIKKASRDDIKKEKQINY